MPSNRRNFLKRSLAAAAGSIAAATTQSSSGAEASRSDAAGQQSAAIEFSRRIPVRHEADVFVAGGGPAGVAAAVAAARGGAKVFLAERNCCLGGMGTAGLLPAFCDFADGQNLLADGVGRDVLRRYIAAGGHRPKGGLERRATIPIRAEILKRVYDDLLLEANVAFLLQTDLIAVEADEGKVSAAVLAAKSGLFAIKAKVFLDCTGDGDLAVWAGAPFEKGDRHGNLMPGTLCSLWADIDWDAVNNNGKRIRDNSRLEDAFRDKAFTVEDRHLPGMYHIGIHLSGGNIGHAFNLDGTDERSLTKALIDSRKLLLEYERYYKKYLKGFERMELAATAAQMGVRESRRILGDYVLNLEDFKSRAVFPDEIGRYNYSIDIHPSKHDPESYKRFLDDITTLRCPNGESYGIPYRSLVPQKLTNVLVAGRCISTDRHMQSSVRVMPGCYITGQAIGAAAALAARGDGNVRDVPIRQLQSGLKALGAFLPNCS